MDGSTILAANTHTMTAMPEGTATRRKQNDMFFFVQSHGVTVIGATTVVTGCVDLVKASRSLRLLRPTVIHRCRQSPPRPVQLDFHVYLPALNLSPVRVG